jgi:DNA-3-methyladenine glycosylase
MIPQTFYNQDVSLVAQALIGAKLVFYQHQGIITETEAYGGSDDPASHAYRGPTPRAKIMFDQPGLSYIYLIYGMHYCFNVVAHTPGSAGAVLIRGLLLNQTLIDGPGKLCRQLGINQTHHQHNLATSPHFHLCHRRTQPAISVTPRIGIRHGQDKLWRFVLKPAKKKA